MLFRSGYLVEYSTDFGSTWTLATTIGATDTRTATISGLANGVQVTIRVSATNATGTGLGVTKSATPSGPPGLPSNLTPIASGVGSVSLSWSAPSDNGGMTISGYMIQQRVYSPTTPNAWTQVTANTGNNATFYSVNGLSGGVTYEFRVAAKTQVNEIGRAHV